MRADKKFNKQLGKQALMRVEKRLIEDMVDEQRPRLKSMLENIAEVLATLKHADALNDEQPCVLCFSGKNMILKPCTNRDLLPPKVILFSMSRYRNSNIPRPPPPHPSP